MAAVAGERIRLDVRERESRGSRDARRLRRQGLIPGVLYGRSKPRAICVPERELRRVLSGDHGVHTILDVVLEGQKTAHASILKDFQNDPLKGRLIHVDLQEVRLDQPIHAQVTVNLLGEPAGVTEGGVLSQATLQVNVEALPMEVPDRLEVDVSGLAIGEAVRVSDVQAAEGVTILDDPDDVIASVTMPTRVVEPEEMQEAEEGAAPPPGEQAPQGGSEAQPGGDAAGSPGTAGG